MGKVQHSSGSPNVSDSGSEFLQNITLPPDDDLRLWTFDYDYETKENQQHEVQTNAMLAAVQAIEVELKDVAQLQRQCEQCSVIMDYLEQGILPDDDKAARKLILESELYCIKQGVL